MILVGKEIVINARGMEKRVAILEDRELVEILYQRDSAQQVVGNIYKGRVENVLPGMQAAFVNVGLEKNVFLHLKALPAEQRENKRIEQILNPGQNILLQIAKEAVGTKGPKGSCKLDLPGRYVVLLNDAGHIGVSRRIEGEERTRLKRLAQEITPQDKGIIVRTAAAYKSDSQIKNDFNFLLKLWNNMQKKAKKVKAPALVYRDLDLILQIVRDKFTQKVDKLIIDSREDYHQVISLLEDISPKLQSKVYYYNHSRPLFSHYDIEDEIDGLLKRRVNLDCGGYLIIDQTEALTAIDVNTGKFVGDNNNLEDTVLKANLEAAKEIASQLRLRDIGGIIIIDFIDMKSKQSQQQVLELLEDELEDDKTQTEVLGLTQLGLLEMTRKKERETVSHFLQQDCPYCQGTGKILTLDTVVLEALHRLREICWSKKRKGILLEANIKVLIELIRVALDDLRELEKRSYKKIYMRCNSKSHREDINLIGLKSKAEVKEYFSELKIGDRITLKVKERGIDKRNGAASIDGHLIEIINGGVRIGQEVEVEIKELERLYAKAEIIG